MSDPIEELNRLGDAMEGAPMPLPASEVRARGDRIRRRRHAAIAGASAAVVAAVAVPVVAFTVNGSDDRPDIAPSPTISDPVPMPSEALGEQNLLTSKDAIYPNGGADWREAETFEGDGQGAASPCQQSSYAALGADSVFQRQFDFISTDTGDVEPSLNFNEVVAEFPSGAGARSAYDQVRAWLRDCLPSPAEYYNAGKFSAVTIGVDGSAELQLSTFGPVDEELDPFGDEAWYLETGLVLSGDRIAVLSQLTHTQDYNWLNGTPVEQMLPTAAERLAVGNDEVGTGDPTGTPDLSSSAGATTVPEGFPLDLAVGEPPVEDSETTIEGPAADVEGIRAQTACGSTLAIPNAGDPDPDHELGYATSTVGGYEGRTIRAYPSVQDALEQMTLLRSQLQGCARDSDGDSLSDRLWRTFSSDTGYDSVTFGYTYEIKDGVGAPAGQLYTVVRVGSAVLAVEWSGEYSAEYQSAAAPDQVELARLMAADMCVFTVDGC